MFQLEIPMAPFLGEYLESDTSFAAHNGIWQAGPLLLDGLLLALHDVIVVADYVIIDSLFCLLRLLLLL